MNFHWSKRFSIAGLVLLLISSCTQARAQEPDKPEAGEHGVAKESDANHPAKSASRLMAERVQVTGVPNFGEVSPRIFRGGQPSFDGLEQLAKMGVNIIVNLRPGDHADEEREATRLGMQYVAIPWQCYHPSDTAIAEFLTVLHENPTKKIFVHCQHGSDRTGMSIAAHRMSDEGWSAEDAQKEMKAFGFNRSHRLACHGLSDYEKNFPEQFRTSPEFENLRSVRASGDSQSEP
jgi:tyrosine-protein phosphatase SIW14